MASSKRRKRRRKLILQKRSLELLEGIKASKPAIKLAEENGIDLKAVKGTGRNGAIGVGDVRKMIPKAKAAPKKRAKKKK